MPLHNARWSRAAVGDLSNNKMRIGATPLIRRDREHGCVDILHENLAIHPMSDLAQYGEIDVWSSPLLAGCPGAGK